MTLKYLRGLIEAGDADTCWEALERLRWNLGFDYCGVGIIASDGHEISNISLHRGSGRFQRAFARYREMGLDQQDPMAKAIYSNRATLLAEDALILARDEEQDAAIRVLNFLKAEGFLAHAAKRMEIPTNGGRAYLGFGNFDNGVGSEFRKRVKHNDALLGLGAVALANASAYDRPTGASDLLTATELRVLKMLAAGAKLREIAEHERKSFSTVRRQADQVRKRLGARTLAHAVNLARDLDIM